MHALFSSLQHFFEENGTQKTYWLALSGGLDSIVLLSLCHELRSQLPLNLRAIHINHNLNPHAKNWARHCERICKTYDVEYLKREIKIQLASGESLEQVARVKRYQIFSELISAGDYLLTAHHQDDQAETLLLQLLRGSGLKGLAAMPKIKSFAKGFLARPLLDFSKECLLEFAKQRQLQWMEDESNLNTHFTRNYLRHTILPLLKTRWPTVAATLSRSATHCAEAQGLLEEFTASNLNKFAGSAPNTLSVRQLLSVDKEQQKLLLRTWIHQLGFTLPDARKLQAIQNNVLLAAWDRTPCVIWGQINLRRYRDDLYIMPAIQSHQHDQFEWELTHSLLLPGIGHLQTAPILANGLRASVKKVTVRFRRGGEKANLPGRGRHSLKNLFQEWKIPPWERQRVPLIFHEDKLIAVVGKFIDPDYLAKENEIGFNLTLNPEISL